ncbi:MAG: hypothetical protein R3F49_07715 [Planctomycetota bacterium]
MQKYLSTLALVIAGSTAWARQRLESHSARELLTVIAIAAMAVALVVFLRIAGGRDHHDQDGSASAS